MNKTRRIEPELPKFRAPKMGAGFILGIFVWLFAMLVFAFIFYLTLFSQNFSFLIKRIFKKNVYPPFWFSLLFVIFLFPFSLLVILVGALWKMLE